MNALALEHISKSYILKGAERPVLKDINLKVEHNEIVAIVGASGCGKSTLLRLVVGLDADYRGTERGREAVGLEGPPSYASPSCCFR